MNILDIVRGNLLIDEIVHGLFALPFVYLMWKKTKSFKLSILVLVSTYAIDSDHLLDYFSYVGFDMTIPGFFSLGYIRMAGQALVIFHAWEWVLVLLYISYKRGWKSYWTVLLLALSPHLIYDSITVGSIKFYSIIYRILTSFALP